MQRIASFFLLMGICLIPNTALASGGCFTTPELIDLKRDFTNVDNRYFYGLVEENLGSFQSGKEWDLKKFSVKVVKSIAGPESTTVEVIGIEWRGSDKEYQTDLWRFFSPVTNESWSIGASADREEEGYVQCHFYPLMRVGETYLFFEDKEFDFFRNFPLPVASSEK